MRYKTSSQKPKSSNDFFASLKHSFTTQPEEIIIFFFCRSSFLEKLSNVSPCNGAVAFLASYNALVVVDSDFIAEKRSSKPI